MDAIIDFETLSIDPCYAIVLSGALILFDPDRFLSKKPYQFSELVHKGKVWNVNVDEQKKLGWKVDKETLLWWKKKDIKLNFHGSDNIGSFVDEIEKIFQKVKPRALWCRGSNFDHVILRRFFNHQNKDLDDVVHYTAYRDVRTYMDLITGFQDKPITKLWSLKDHIYEFQAHDPLHDVAFDIIQMQKLLRTMKGLE